MSDQGDISILKNVQKKKKEKEIISYDQVNLI